MNINVNRGNRSIRSPFLIAFVNRQAFEIAERHGVLITDLTSTRCKQDPVVAARMELVKALRDQVVYADSRTNHPENRTYMLASEVPSHDGRVWNKISTVDIARCLSANHSSIVLILRRASAQNGESTETEGAA